MRRFHGFSSLALSILVSLSACTDHSTEPLLNSPRASMTISQDMAGERRNTPWASMTDEVLAARVSDAGGRVFIGFKDAASDAGVDDLGRTIATPASITAGKELLRSAGVRIDRQYDGVPAVVATIPANATAALRHNPLIEYIEPIFPGTWASQDTAWNISRVNAPLSWSYSTGGNVRAMILDSGAGNGHPDLSYSTVANCVDQNPGYDAYGHGTFAAGIVGAINNTSYLIGASHGVSLWSTLVGYSVPDPAAVWCGVLFARANSVFVVNMSINIGPYTALTDQINGGYNQDGMLFVAAAGNTGGGAVTYPASLANVIAVTATDANNTRGSFTAIGSEIELAAPGVSVWSTSLPSGQVCSTGGYTTTCSGTSFAAPHVTAVAALVKSYYPSWTNSQIRSRLRESATDLGTYGKDDYYGYGLVNALEALFPELVVPPIGGSGLITEMGTYEWSVSASGGDDSYTYAWELKPYGGSWTSVGDEPSYSLFVNENQEPYFDLRVTVTSGPYQVVRSLRVSVDISD